MRKSLILASLLLIGTNSIASNYMKLEYKTSTAKFNEIETNNPNFTIDSDGYAISWNRDAEKYSLAAGYFNSKTEISRYINSNVGNTEVSYDSESTKIYIDGALKIQLLNKVFFAPWLSYTDDSTKYRYTTLSTGKKTYYEGSSDTDLRTGVYIGYSLKQDVDSYAYVSLTIDDDLFEVDEHDYHDLTIGVNYAINADYILSGSYSQNLSKDKVDDDTNKISSVNSSSFVFGVGYIF
jgi:hypothetical protein